MEQVTGMAWITGHVDDQPRIQQGPSDPNAGMHAAFALIVGLAEREATGRGSLLEVTMVEGALNAACELVLEKTAYGNLLERDGNRSPNVAPQGLRVPRDDRGWRSRRPTSSGALVVPRTPAWAATASRLRRHARPRCSTITLRSGCRADVAETAVSLVARGVPAAVGRDPRSLYDHPQLQARAFYEQIDHPIVGPRATPTLPFRFASVDRWLRTPAPTMGQHNHEILVDDLGLDEAEYAALEAKGIIGDRPKGL
jgi:crotonobetainyl-CoA:carnitine CoA-transferase CaiB-like acyl-CoA transferase